MNKLIGIVLLITALIGAFYAIASMNANDNAKLVEEVLQIEQAIKERNEYPSQETIDRLYRFRNGIDSKYSLEGPSVEFCEVYDRVIKPL